MHSSLRLWWREIYVTRTLYARAMALALLAMFKKCSFGGPLRPSANIFFKYIFCTPANTLFPLIY
eukprot:UN28011